MRLPWFDKFSTMATTTTYNRLRSIFSNLPTRTTSKPTTEIPDPVKPKPVSEIRKPSKPKPVSETANSESSQESGVASIVKKFKNSSDSLRFRRRNFYYEAAVRRLASRGQFSAIHDILDHQKRYPDITDERFAVRLICLYGQARMFNEARKLFDELPSLKCEQTVVSFNALMGACINSRDFDKVQELFKEIPAKLSVEPDIVSYNTVIKALCAMGSSDSAVLLMDEMEKNNVKPDTVTFNTLLDAFYKTERFSEGEKLWSLMEKKDVMANVRSYNARLRGLVAVNQTSDAVELIDEMRVKGVEPDNFSYNAVIKGFVDDGDLEEAKEWYERMVENERTPDKATFGMLIPFACDKNDFDYAFELCKKSIKTKQSVYNSVVQRVIDGLVERSKNDEAKKLKKMAKFE